MERPADAQLADVERLAEGEELSVESASSSVSPRTRLRRLSLHIWSPRIVRFRREALSRTLLAKFH